VAESKPLKLSQGLEVLKPKRDQALPIPCNEWDELRKQIQLLDAEPWLYFNVGSNLLGASLATLISIILGAISTTERVLAIAWAVVATTGFVGLACWHIAAKERNLHRSKAAHVLTLMDSIERRFERQVGP